MKTLLLARHGNAEALHFGSTDFFRKLSAHGQKEASTMAMRLSEKGIFPEVILTSPATRAKETALIFGHSFHLSLNHIINKTELYLASAQTLEETVSLIPASVNAAMIVGHNPGISVFINGLCENVTLDNMPTCGVFVVEIDAGSWDDFTKSKKTFAFFDHPLRNGCA